VSRHVVSCTATTLGELGPAIEKEVQAHLQGLLGGFVRAYLPQAWLFRTEQDVASLRVDPSGKVTVSPTAAPQPDVTVEGPHDRLRDALRSRGRDRPPAGTIRVTAVTARGRAAVNLLGSRLGL